MSLAAVIVLIVAVTLLFDLLVVWALVLRNPKPTEFDRRCEAVDYDIAEIQRKTPRAMSEVDRMTEHWDASNSVRYCDRCESEQGAGAADPGDRACSACGNDAPHVYVPLATYQGAVDLLDEIRSETVVSFEDPRVSYVDVQMTRETWNALRRFGEQ